MDSIHRLRGENNFYDILFARYGDLDNRFNFNHKPFVDKRTTTFDICLSVKCCRWKTGKGDDISQRKAKRDEQLSFSWDFYYWCREQLEVIKFYFFVSFRFVIVGSMVYVQNKQSIHLKTKNRFQAWFFSDFRVCVISKFVGGDWGVRTKIHNSLTNVVAAQLILLQFSEIECFWNKLK